MLHNSDMLLPSTWISQPHKNLEFIDIAFPETLGSSSKLPSSFVMEKLVATDSSSFTTWGSGSSVLLSASCNLKAQVQIFRLHTLRLPPVMVTLTKRRVYVIRFLARPLGVFFFSCGSTFGVWDFTLPARAREP